ncbi:28S ribosomal protein S22, mitochondrial [Episyrphus balteatus]|uniref:28S ribosomal protein S22, mitochondrial n=1 Tax=Episyrphus balteatus TaxID=286459 RepID=UPI002486BB1B|nr:28S ribosomal protein S22, mitochondrial [Episyrphus balteatus]
MSIASNLRNAILRKPLCIDSNKILTNLCARYCSNNTLQYDKDPSSDFLNPKIQSLLKSLTRVRLDKVFRKRSVTDNTVEYKFLTTEQLEDEFKRIIAESESNLQMPPVVMVKQDQQKIISQDPALKNFADSKFVITDITFGIKQNQRKVIVRQIDGTLEYAPIETTKRMIQTYFPLPGRKIRTPRMFEEKNLQKCLDEFKYEFVLDRLCIQYEPFEKEFHSVSAKVYSHINEHKKFDDLRSTRHFGPMAFFLAWHKQIDDLLYDVIKRDYLRNGVELITILYQIHKIPFDESVIKKLESIPQSSDILGELKKSYQGTSDDIHEEIKSAIGKSREDFEADDICLGFIENFVKQHALKKVQLEMAIQTFKEDNDEKKKLYEGLRKAHGVST